MVPRNTSIVERVQTRIHADASELRLSPEFDKGFAVRVQKKD